MKISIWIPEDVLAEVDELAELDDRSRSAWITRALRRELQHTPRSSNHEKERNEWHH